jgi:hypothetical protein
MFMLSRDTHTSHLTGHVAVEHVLLLAHNRVFEGRGNLYVRVVA